MQVVIVMSVASSEFHVQLNQILEGCFKDLLQTASSWHSSRAFHHISSLSNRLPGTIEVNILKSITRPLHLVMVILNTNTS